LKTEEEYFPLPLTARYVGEGCWKLLKPFEYHPDKGKRITVPEGFVSDGASIPKFFYSFIGGRWTGRYVKAAVLHDWLYHSQPCKRKKADQVFIETMNILGVGWLRRGTMYNAVRAFGFIPWNKVKKLLP